MERVRITQIIRIRPLGKMHVWRSVHTDSCDFYLDQNRRPASWWTTEMVCKARIRCAHIFHARLKISSALKKTPKQTKKEKKNTLGLIIVFDGYSNLPCFRCESVSWCYMVLLCLVCSVPSVDIVPEFPHTDCFHCLCFSTSLCLCFSSPLVLCAYACVLWGRKTCPSSFHCNNFLFYLQQPLSSCPGNPVVHPDLS